MERNIVKYFPGLDTLRFLAALAVIISHIELLKGAFGIVNIWHHPLMFELGSLGVSFFFVLSGFLITYLLFIEETKNGIINIKHFYLRRIYRIWPLFYLVLVLGFFILPHIQVIQIKYLQSSFEEHYWGQFFSYLFILPNLGHSIYEAAVPHIGQSWSIGVEEQFYLFWPIVFYYSKNRVKTFILLFIIIIAVKLVFLTLSQSFENIRILEIIKLFLAMSKIENMIIGALGAWIFFTNRKRILLLFYNPVIVAISLVSIPAIILFAPDYLQNGYHIVYSIVFLAVILNVATNSKSIIKLEYKMTSYLGKISYGLYMYHMMIIPFVIVALKHFGFLANLSIFQFNFCLYFLTLSITILVSGISYRFFELPFILLKNKITHLKNGSD